MQCFLRVKVHQFDRRITVGGKPVGGLTAWQYTMQADSDLAFDGVMRLVAQEGTGSGMRTVPELDDHTVAGQGSYGNYDLAMQRGYVVAYVRMSHVDSISDVIAYAQRLDALLGNATCGRGRS